MRIKSAPYDSLLHRAYRTMTELNGKSHYIRQIDRIKKKTGWDGTEKDVKACIMRYCIDQANKRRSEFIKTTFVFPEASLQTFKSEAPHLDFTELSKLSNRFMLLNTRIGNRAPLSTGRQHKACPLCGDKLNEIHLLIECKPLEPVRMVVGIRSYINACNEQTSIGIYKEFWNIWKITKETRNKRAKAAQTMLEAYTSATNTL